MIPFLSQLLLKLVECVGLYADWCSTAFFDYAENTCKLVHLVLTNVDMLLNTVYRSSFKVIVRI